ncbi:hypothetical protein JRQ81_015052 [Phrynocephalus forsythii]|uniref:RNA-binding protein 15 n=1 Tax=Phrynocephalus forsythii TaxID=171643 RepID=A0A9Q0XYJ9_9SAUR|nr:hypothetical protein JRQ81_015052 [Phrynocephalus forsythii]
MKGKERSPAKAKRSRGGDESSSARGERSSKKPSNGGGKSAGGGSGEGGGGGSSSSSSRRSLHLEKASRASSREYESGTAGGGGSSSSSRHGYSGSNSSSTKNAESSSRGSRGGGGGGDSRALPSESSSSSGGGEYKTLKISELGSALSDEAIEDGLFHEFKRFGDVSVKISRLPPGTGTGDERVAFVNFRRPEDARAAKHARGRLVLYDRPLKIEAVYVGGGGGGGSGRRRSSRSPAILDKEPYGAAAVGVPAGAAATLRHPPTGATQRALSPAGGGAGLGYRDFRLQQLALGRLPPPPLPRELERERDYGGFYDRVRPAYSLERVAGVAAAAAFRGVGATGAATEEEISPEDDQRANRTLFLGNLDISVTESDLRRAFDRFGVITEVDIKRPSRGQTSTYGFLKFENLDMAHRAKLAMSGKVLLRNPIKIGYGKATPTTRLWVGGLGPWVPLAALAREFDRFGTIRTIDYRKGDSWAYIQYESLDAAQAACTHMRGFPLGGPDRRLRVDFADTEHRYQQPYLQPLPLPPPAHYELVAETSAFGAHRAPPDPLRGARDRTSPLLYERDRDLYPETEWVPPPPPVRDRGNRATVYDALESLERRRDGWSLERTRGERELGSSSRDPPRKRRIVEDGGRHLDRSPDSERSSSSRKRHCPAAASPQNRSPEPGIGRDRYSSDAERPSSRLLLLDRPSPIREPHRGSLERGQSDKREHKSSVERERKHRALILAATQECKSPAKKDDHATEGSSSGGSRLKPPPQKQQQQDGTTKPGSSPKLCLAWQGMLLLKNSNFPSNMHLLQGDLNVASSLLVEGATGGKVAQLKITQRLRLDQPKLDEVTRRIKVAGPNGYAILLAVPGTADNRASSGAGEANTTSTQRPLRNLVSYLKQKQAAGVISLPVGGNKDKENSGVLHAFPPCDFSQQFLDTTAKALAKSEDDYLVMIIVRGAS